MMRIQSLHSFRQYTLLALAISLAIGLVPTSVFADANNKLYVTPSSSQGNVGSSLIINVKSYIASASTSTVSGSVIYPTSLLQVTNISIGGSNYGSPTITQGSGTVGFSGSGNTGTGIKQIFTITFKMRAAGKATIKFSNDSEVNNTTPDRSGGTYTITDPSPPPVKSSSTPKPSPKPSKVPVVTTTPTPSTTPSPQVSPDPTGVVDSVSVTSQYSSSAISWKVNASHSSSTLSYGSSYSESDKQAVVKKGSDGTFSTTISGLSPGITYYFTITGKGTGVDNGTYSESFTTQGFPILLTVTENNTPVKNAQVQIGSQTYSVLDGKLAVGLAAGSYTGTITTDTATLTINLTVAEKTVPTDGSAPESQSFAFNLTSSPLEGGPGSGVSIFAFIGVLIGGSALLTLGFLLYINYRRHQFESGTSYTRAPSSTVVIDDGYDWHQDADAQDPSQQSGPVASSPDPASPQSPEEHPVHANSVYISEEEPLDMFEQAKIILPPASSASHPSADEMPQTPNPPHSTKP